MPYKNCFLLLCFLVIATAAQGQSAEESFKQVKTLADANSFINKYPSQKPVLHALNSARDTTARNRVLYKMKAGDIIRIGQITYKIIDKTAADDAFRASYIYLDGSKLTLPVIDSLRSLIIKKYTAGVSFEELCDKYTMDGNRNHGDLGFFKAGMMVKEFEDGVRLHSKGEVFTIDVPRQQWYYVAKKTADNKVTVKMNVLSIQ